MASVRARVGAGKGLVAERGFLLIADISGYTKYVIESPLTYAEDVVADVTGTVVEHLERVLHVNKLEGDAAFGYALEGRVDGSMLLDAIDECYFAFRRRLRGIEHSTSCTCPACTKLPDLNLKFVVHYGDFIRRPGARGEELTGQAVILVHRLLKNAAAEALGLHGYALLTEDCVTALGIDPAVLNLREHTERYPDVGEVRTHVLDLETRWEREQERATVYVGPEEAGFEVDAVLPGEPALVWEYLTAPAKRTLWQADRVEEVNPAGRRGAGTTSFCVDGRSAIYEEILDWRPFHYFTERNTLAGSVKLVLTTELEATQEGTRVTTRARRLDGKDRLVWLALGPRIRRKLARRYGRLAALLASAIPEDRGLPLAASASPPTA